MSGRTERVRHRRNSCLDCLPRTSPCPRSLISLHHSRRYYSVMSDRSKRLVIDRVDDEVEQLTDDFLAQIVEVNVNGRVPDINRLAGLLQRCPQVVTLSCSSRRIDMSTNNSLSSTVVPNLRKFIGPWPLALHFVPGRPIEELTLENPMEAEPDAWPTVSDLSPLASGCGGVRYLCAKALRWNESCMEDMAEIFPKVETVYCSATEMPDEVSRPSLLAFIRIRQTGVNRVGSKITLPKSSSSSQICAPFGSQRENG